MTGKNPEFVIIDEMCYICKNSSKVWSKTTLISGLTGP